TQFNKVEPRVVTIAAKKLIGKRVIMTWQNNRIAELWGSFMPRRKEITNNLSTELISMQVYTQPGDMGNPDRPFEKWAAVEVNDLNSVPYGMEAFELPGGL